MLDCTFYLTNRVSNNKIVDHDASRYSQSRKAVSHGACVLSVTPYSTGTECGVSTLALCLLSPYALLTFSINSTFYKVVKRHTNLWIFHLHRMQRRLIIMTWISKQFKPTRYRIPSEQVCSVNFDKNFKFILVIVTY